MCREPCWQQDDFWSLLNASPTGSAIVLSIWLHAAKLPAMLRWACSPADLLFVVTCISYYASRLSVLKFHDATRSLVRSLLAATAEKCMI
jgi:hypothetical protein